MLDAQDRAALARWAPVVGLAVVGLLGGAGLLGAAVRVFLWGSGVGGGC